MQACCTATQQAGEDAWRRTAAMPAGFFASLAGWFVCTTVFSLSAKAGLAGSDLVPHPTVATPLALATLCFAAGLLLTSILRPRLWCNLPSVATTVDPPQLLMSLAHTGGTLLTLTALASGSVAVTYAVKACEPLTTAALTMGLLGSTYTAFQLYALLPVAAGLALASGIAGAGGSLVSGAVPAILSNIAFSARATLAKLKQTQLETATASPRRRHTPSRQGPGDILAQFGYTTAAVAPIAAPRTGPPVLESPSPSPGLRGGWAEVGSPEGRAAGGGALQHPLEMTDSEAEEGGDVEESMGLLLPHRQLPRAVEPPAEDEEGGGRAILPPPSPPPYAMNNIDRLLLANAHALLLCTFLLSQDPASLNALGQLWAGLGFVLSTLDQYGSAMVVGEEGEGGWLHRVPPDLFPAEGGELETAALQVHQAATAGHVLNAAGYHALFSLMSFSVLTHVTPAQHAIGNVAKRLFMIACSAWWLDTALAPPQAAGAAVAVLGVGAFFALPPPSPSRPHACASCTGVCAAAGTHMVSWCRSGLGSWVLVSALHVALVMAVYLGHSAAQHGTGGMGAG